MANDADPDQSAPKLLPKEQSDLGLHCLQYTIFVRDVAVSIYWFITIHFYTRLGRLDLL